MRTDHRSHRQLVRRRLWDKVPPAWFCAALTPVVRTLLASPRGRCCRCWLAGGATVAALDELAEPLLLVLAVGASEDAATGDGPPNEVAQLLLATQDLEGRLSLHWHDDVEGGTQQGLQLLLNDLEAVVGLNVRYPQATEGAPRAQRPDESQDQACKADPKEEIHPALGSSARLIHDKVHCVRGFIDLLHDLCQLAPAEAPRGLLDQPAQRRKRLVHPLAKRDLHLLVKHLGYTQLGTSLLSEEPVTHLVDLLEG
mmetsp:Transcript_8979/g.24972  ORF Transcript_8979/g.24972 Transcript_8979/m.24972 type:complete len:255 (-) Transcript_8979:346-1110(-)